jgi:NADH-quinone oxidoreductase subunit G
VAAPGAMVSELAAIARALGASGADATVEDRHQAVADQLKQAENGTVLLGNVATAHPDFSLLRSLAAAIADAAGAKLGYLPEAANSVGGHLVGALPKDGKNTQAMLDQACKGYLLMGIEPAYDLHDPSLAAQAMEKADCVVAMSAFRSPSLESLADVILPIATFAETSGTYVNAAGDWQAFSGAVTPRGSTRPAWKVLRVLGNLLDLEGFSQVSSEEILAEVKVAAQGVAPDNTAAVSEDAPRMNGGLGRVGDVPLYALDALVRRAPALQKTRDAIAAAIYMNATEAGKAGLSDGDSAVAVQNGNRAELPVVIDPSVPDGAVRIPAALAGTESLGAQIGEVTLEKV